MTSPEAPYLKAPATQGVRFAPSPTGRFHVGNLRTAWISHLWAKTLALPWVVRIEDIDKPRVLSGAQELQLADMKSIGLEPDFCLTQSHFSIRHWELFVAGARSGHLYPCDCSRKDVQHALAGIASAPHDGVGPIYSGHCRPLSKRTLRATESIAWRFRMPAPSGSEDFIIARTGVDLDADGLPNQATFVPAYHWACAIDDFDGDYDLLVRSADLKPAAHVQRAIHEWIAAQENKEKTRIPAVFHTSLITQNDGHRLEKRTKGVTLPELLARGISAARLLELFANSFDRSQLTTSPRAGELLQERIDRRTLAELGL